LDHAMSAHRPIAFIQTRPSARNWLAAKRKPAQR
jgi:hypothetical protein